MMRSRDELEKATVLKPLLRNSSRDALISVCGGRLAKEVNKASLLSADKSHLYRCAIASSAEFASSEKVDFTFVAMQIVEECKSFENQSDSASSLPNAALNLGCNDSKFKTVSFISNSITSFFMPRTQIELNFVLT
ncbi:hypothetical protein VCRA2122O339_80142 [Vibrio crassostreae]|nr:hypothetical protein VCRA2117O328_110064 [Vibrio crassostreae]CAK2233447.1 hypothetical protein VCRA2110O318_100137 [Vibrio crassostreae]CAK2395409.1 hypothetical protein VCRA2110O319_100135 [Vibrio crassostreae]CAK2569698.1 hypothetical protein VCRA217O317_100068 [Vibrio crassostreae]CAK3674604.1 hypothetical protein VCRA2122O339_80142 [Vibrio crassostreae]